MTSDEGLNAYGAATWGQFFIYQGFNAHAGWMHTSSGVDNVDEFAETVERRGKGYLLPLRQRHAGRSACGRSRSAIAPRTGGSRRAASPPIAPITARSSASTNGSWIAFAMMNQPVEALQQSFLRTKATDLASFLQVAELKANSSNNTIVRRRQGRDRLSPPAVRAAARRPLRLHQAGRRQRSRDRLERRCTRSTSCRT